MSLTATMTRNRATRNDDETKHQLGNFWMEFEEVRNENVALYIQPRFELET